MRLTKKGEYALRTLIRLGIAEREGKGVTSVSSLAEQERLPFKFLEAILFELRGEVRRESGRPLPASGTLSPCRLGILFDPVHGAVSIQVLDAKGEFKDVR